MLAGGESALIVTGPVPRLPSVEGISGQLTAHVVELGEMLARLNLRGARPASSSRVTPS